MTNAQLTREEQAFLMKAVWSALQSPAWKKDDLIDFGTAIFSKQDLSEMPEKTFKKIFPFLAQITNDLGAALSAQAELIAEKMQKDSSEDPPPPAAEETPAPPSPSTTEETETPV